MIFKPSSARLYLALFVLSLACALTRADSSRDNPNSDWLPPNIDWDQAEQIHITLRDHSYQPQDLHFQIDRPYKIIFDNISASSTHNLVSIDFFHAVVLKTLITGREIIDTPHIHSLKLRPEGKVELHLVAKKSGRFTVFCSIGDHRAEGMEGLFTIEPDSAANDS